jgi:hypothetical protein
MHEAPPPAKTDVADVARRVHARALAWLHKRRYLDERSVQERGNDAPEQTPIDAFAALALAAGTFLGRPCAPSKRASEDLDRNEPRFSARHNGFDGHGDVRIAADDDEGRKRLIRSCARPPFALERIEALKDGPITYAVKTPRRGSTHRGMSPVEFLARLAILVAPPSFPLGRYHGVFAARSSWRGRVTPKPPDGVEPRNKSNGCTDATAAEADAKAAAGAPTTPEPSANASPNALPSALAPAPAALPAALPSALPAAPIPAPSARPAGPIVVDDLMTLTAEHCHRILEGQLFATSSRGDWAILLRRTYGLDALRCPDARPRCPCWRPSPSRAS